MKLLSAMGGINDLIETHNHPSDKDEDEAEKPSKGKTGIKEVDGLYKKLDALEHGEKRLQKETELLQKDILELTQKYKRSLVSLRESQLRS